MTENDIVIDLVLGKGSFGTVSKVFNTEDNLEYAVKTFSKKKDLKEAKEEYSLEKQIN